MSDLENQGPHGLGGESDHALHWGKPVIVVCTKPHCRCRECCERKPPLGCYASDQAQDTDTISWVFVCLGFFLIFLVVLSFIQFSMEDSEHVHHTHPVG